MDFNRRALLSGAAAFMAALFIKARPGAAFTPPLPGAGMRGFIASVPRKNRDWLKARESIFASKWQYQSLGERKGILKHLESGQTFSSLPGPRRDEFDAMPQLTGGQILDEDSRRMSSAAAQVATWAEAVGGGSLLLSFRPDDHRDDPDSVWMGCKEVPKLVPGVGTSMNDEIRQYLASARKAKREAPEPSLGRLSTAKAG